MKEIGASLDDVVRTRIYDTDISKLEDIAGAHYEFFETTKPLRDASQFSKLIDPELLIEIEVEEVTE